MKKKTREILRARLLHWFAEHGRDLPWRRTYSPYHIWISEIMLQQTQMDRAVSYFERWMKHLPHIAAVADAPEEKILKLWEGLGYYNRARNIHRSALLLLQNHMGKLPEDYDELLRLPGIGKYTAGAIMSLAFNRDYPVVDANVERIFSRLFNISTPIKSIENRNFLWETAQDLLPAGKARSFNQALMELGGLICLPEKPQCRTCPFTDICEAFRHDLIAERPVKPGKKRTVYIEMATGILVHRNRIFIQKRPSEGVWANLWEFPGGQLEKNESPEEALVREFAEETELAVGRLVKIGVVKHSYTFYRVTLHCYFCRLTDGGTTPVLHAAQQYRWISRQELPNHAFPAGHRKLLELLQHHATAFPG